MKRLLPLLLFASATLAQPVEEVTVTAARTRAAITAFVESYAAPSRMTGKMARWETGICPAVIGLPPDFARFLIDRVKAVAADVGAPVGTAGCSRNIQIVFTDKPQPLLDEMRTKMPDVLGYLDNSAQRDAAAVMRRPIQAWYMTETVDVRGARHVDSSQHGGGIEIKVSPRLPPMFYPHAHAAAVTGSRLGDGLRTDFYHVLVVADRTKLTDVGMGVLGDYVAMLALSQPASVEKCWPLSSILNLLRDRCDHPADTLTGNDRAFLRGLYRMGPDRTLRTQEDEVAYQMEQSLIGK